MGFFFVFWQSVGFLLCHMNVAYNLYGGKASEKVMNSTQDQINISTSPSTQCNNVKSIQGKNLYQ